MVDRNIDILAILKHYFKQDFKSNEAAYKI